MLTQERNLTILRSLLLLETSILETQYTNRGAFMHENNLPQYVPPVVLTYTDEEILEELGPARTSGSGGCEPPHHHH